MSSSSQSSLFKEHPGRVYLDAWGWEAGLYYQRDLPYGEDLDYFKRKVIDESYKWGCNSLDVYIQAPPPPIDRYATPMEWHPDDPIDVSSHQGSMEYKFLYDPKWNNANLMELTKYAHSRDMLFDWYLNDVPLNGCAPWYNVVKHLSEEEKARKQVLIYNLLEKIARDFMNPLAHGWQGTLDGIKEEDIPWDYIKADNLMWRYNPGAFIAPTPPYLIFPEVVPPNMIAFYACGNQGRHDGNDPEGQFFPVRRDHDSWHTDYSRIFVTYQGNSRTNRISSAIWGTYFAAHSGGIFPDRILKQCNDYFRPRAKDPEDIHETVIWWLGESENICPPEARRIVLAVSQDPIKCAISISEGSITPGKVSSIQNNHMRVVSHLEKEGNRLLYDPEGLAHFDANSRSFPLAENLVKTIYLDPEGTACERELGDPPQRENAKEIYEKLVTFLEPGGYKSLLREDFRNPDDEHIADAFERESREYLFFSDNPFFQLNIKRALRTLEGRVHTQIGVEGYDRLIVGDASYDEPTHKPVSDLENIFRLEDASGSKPTLFLFLLKKGNSAALIWEPSRLLAFESPAVRKEEIQLAFVVPGLGYASEDMPLLREAMLDEDVPLEFRKDKASLTNKYPIPLVKTIRISNPDDGPYLVKEYGWWMFRGGNPSEGEKGIDFLKVYLEPNGKAVVHRYGFIDGVVKHGWGCQYTVALKDVDSKPSGDSCTARVMSITPLIFAPRLQFKEPFGEVRLNGEPWHYFDEDLVFLPNKTGDYKVGVSKGGEAAPHITRTFASIERTDWTGTELIIKAELPPYAEKLPPDLDLTMALDMAGFNVKKIHGARVVRTTPSGLILGFKPGTIKITAG